MLIKRILIGLLYILNLMKWITSFINKSLHHIKQNGLKALLGKGKDRVSREYVQRIRKPSSIGPSSSTVKAAMSQGNTEYVLISEEHFLTDLAPVKPIAFYLPQFHTVRDSDGWTNISKAVHQFRDHYQPRLPGELGLYDMRVHEVQNRQMELALKYGLYGFAFYYYWFNGQRLFEEPVEMFLADKENKFPFCIFWANENWTRRWDGKGDDVLIAQDHSPENDFAFIKDIGRFLQDERYICIDAKPILLIHKVQSLPEPKESTTRWREYCREAGIGEIYLIATQTDSLIDPRELGFDAALELPPYNVKAEQINDSVQALKPAYRGAIFHYQDLVKYYSQEKKALEYELFKTVVPGWDTEPKNPGGGSIFAYSTP